MAAQEWKWPLPSPYGKDYITSSYGYRSPPTAGATADHKGIDIGAPLGTPIYAIGSGKIISYGTATGYGYWVRIDHGNGVISIYGHVQLLRVQEGSLTTKWRTGDEVKIGDHIADVGNEGTSTGPHLHLQIEYLSDPVDPLKYVSPTGLTILDPSNLSDSRVVNSETEESSSLYSIDATAMTVGRRASELSSQPIHAFINVYIGDNLLVLSSDPAKPNNIISFTYNRLQDAGEKATLTLFDDNWEEIEYVLSNNFDRVYIEYGYPGVGKRSRLIRHLLQNYNISFNFTGAIISVESLSQGVYDNLKQKTIGLDTYNPTEAVKKICLALGYIVRDENFDSSSDIVSDNPFNVIEDYPITYIHSNIIPQASQENEELFSFYVDNDNIAYFKRESYTPSTDDMRTYIYQKGYDSPVISLDFSLGGVFAGSGDFSIATNYRSTVLDPTSKEESSTNITKSSVVTSATGNTTHTRDNQSNPVVDSAGYTPKQVKNRLYYHMKSMRYDGYKANMKIIGDPTLELNEHIRLINMTDKGSLHHTSGVYRINSITDTIQGGTMYTDLELVRNAAYNIDGLEIINPTTLIR